MVHADITRALAEEERRVRDLRLSTLRILLGVILVVGAWLLLPFGISQLTTGVVAALPVLEVVGGVALLAGGVVIVVREVRARRKAERLHASVVEIGKANPLFDEDRRPLPTGGTPIAWIGNVPGS